MPPAFWAAFAFGLVYLVVVARGLPGPVRALKVAPALLLATTVPAHPLVVGGLVLSGVGDAFLLDKKRFMLPGLGAFLLGHLLFIPGFLQISGRVPNTWVMGGLGLLAAALLAFLRPKAGVLRVAVPIYAVGLAAMAASASTLGPLGALGGGTFLLSDALLATNLFRRPFPGADLAVMITYYAALLLLTAAVGG